MWNLLSDLRVAFRSSLKTPGFTAAAVIILALGVTLCTTAVAVMKAYLLTELPYPSAGRLYSVRYGVPGGPQPRGLAQVDWRSLEDVVEHSIAWDLDAFYLLGGEHAETVLGAWVTAGFVEGLGIRPAFGRGFEPAAFAPGGENVALISHRLWNRRFGADPAVIGRTFNAYVSDRPQEAEQFMVIGVLPAGLWHVNGYTDILVPLRAPTYPYMVTLKEGVTAARAAERIAALVRSGARDVPPEWNPIVISTREDYVARTRPMLWTATGAAALVLFVACANVAALLLVRALSRQKEIAVRTALGARRSAIARMLFAEATVLGLTATALALGSSTLILRWMAPVVQQQLGRPAPGGAPAFSLDAATTGFALAAGLLTVAMCTFAPLVTATRARFQQTLQSSGRGPTEGPGSRRVRAGLIAVEIAVSLTLLAGSTLLLRTMVELLRTDLGFRSERVLMASVTLRQNRYPDAATRIVVLERMESRLGEIAGVEAVGLTSAWPVQQPRLLQVRTAEASQSAAAPAGVHRVNAAYFDTLGIRLAAGRPFAKADRLGTEPVVIVSQMLARQLWGAGNAIGRRLVVPQEPEGAEPVPVERLVVGIVGDVRQGPLDENLSDAYVPVLQAPSRFTFVLTRTAGDPSAGVLPFGAAFREIDPEISVQTARPLQAVVDALVARPRFLTSLLGTLAITATLLAVVGVYGVIAYATRQREREIAVRMALGADRAMVTRLFLQQGMRILMIGLALGLPGAMVAGRVLESQLFGVTPRDPLALAVAVAAFASAGSIAVWWPARRAASTDPAIALRAE